MCLNWLCEYLCKPKKINAPKFLEPIGFTEIYTIFQAAFPNTPIYLGDREYKTTTKAELRNYLNLDDTDSKQYVAEYFDCDDFSFHLMGNLSNPQWGALSFGIIWTERNGGGAHALNIFIDNNREVWMIEPQTDEMFKMLKGWKPYLIII